LHIQYLKEKKGEKAVKVSYLIRKLRFLNGKWKQAGAAELVRKVWFGKCCTHWSKE